MLTKIRGLYSAKIVSLVLAVQLFITSIGFNPVFANGGGPTQPEVHSFEPVGTNQMVDPFTGDFTYNIPLFNIPGPDGGYPINLAYHSGIQMEQEASWVGLGWNINVGTINRQVRNMPDDFGGSEQDVVKIKTDMRPNWTIGIGKKKKYELFGFGMQGVQTSPIGGVLTSKLRISYNNYKGLGYSYDLGFKVSMGKVIGEKGDRSVPISGDLGLNVSLNSQEGISPSFSIGHSANKGNLNTTSNVGTGYNTRNGWQQGLNYSASLQKTLRNKKHSTFSGSGGTSLSFAGTPIGMGVPQQMRGGNGQFSFTKGPNNLGLFAGKDLFIDFSYAQLLNKNKEVNYRGVGYMYEQSNLDNNWDQKSDYRIKDISREQETMIHKNTRRLGIPNKNYDLYSVTGQGIGNGFRPFRTDNSANTEPRSKSEYHGGQVGIELGLGSPSNLRNGLSIDYNYSHSETDFWPNPNAADRQPQSTKPSLSNSVYFQNYGEHSVDEIALNYGASVASEKPVVYGLTANDGFYDINGTDGNNGGTPITINTTRSNRKRRAVGVEAFTNQMILNTNNSETTISEFNVKTYSVQSNGYNPSSLTNYSSVRAGRPNTHVGGYIATNEQGVRYVYGIAAYNNKEKDVTFSVEETTGMLNSSQISSIPVDGSNIDYKQKGTDKYYQSAEKSQYAHSYMLTSILGQDYVDYDDIPGPSDGDLGYWVKFNYVRAQTNAAWRSPMEGAIYDKGYENSFKDGKGHYQYGDKEVWYVGTVETKTHVAEFLLSERQDSYAPSSEFNGGVSNSSIYLKIDQIDVYAKSERFPNGQFNASAKPIKTCHFEYDYSLCTGIPNNHGYIDPSPNVSSNQGGKLTLKKVFFTYRNNDTGRSRPYEFEYSTTAGGITPTYNRDAVDRWGNYQPVSPSNPSSNIDYPYNNPLTLASDMAERASLWSIKAINLPSGGRYEIDYESDSYGYVQNEVAMHMYKIVSLEPQKDNNNQTIPNTGDIDHPKDAPDKDRKVFFQLEVPISQSLTLAERKKLMSRYLLENQYMYFKVKVNMTKNVDSKEYVAGYARVKEIDVDNTSGNGTAFTRGMILLDFIHVDGEPTNFHPFTEAGARHIKYNHPELLYDNPANADKEKLSKSDIKNAGLSLLSNATDIVDIFKDFTAMMYGDGSKRLNQIDLDLSYIRLRTPDKVKYGGGHRVKEVRIIDNWEDSFLLGEEATSVYGTVYDYSMIQDGDTISSGVAAYEPMVGGDEIALRNPIKGWEDKNILSKTLAQTYTEEPGNESLFPGPTVGYRQVRVMSKNTASKLATPNSSIVNYGGVTVHEFYTAKDYPVIRDVTELENGKTFRKSRLVVPALLVNIDRTRMAASQGYYIELNDMHGKPKGGCEIGFDDLGNEVEVSKVKYEYFDTETVKNNDAGEKLIVRKLQNTVDVLYSDVDPNDGTKSDIRPSTIATEVEFIPETRYHESKDISGGLHINFETYGIIPAFFPIPSFNWRAEKTGTVVTNKIVNKSGIMRAVTATQRGSTVKTENMVFDEYTGQPLLTNVVNDYGNKVYNYTILAHDQYEGTGPAYQNIGESAFGSPVASSFANGLQRFTLTNGSVLFEGDELLATPITSVLGQNVPDNTRSKFVCYYNHQNGASEYVIETKQELIGLYDFTIIRSGRRNMLGTSISSIVALSNPTINRVPFNCEYSPGGGHTNYITQRKIDDVLSIGAVELGQHWYKDTRQLSDVSPSWFDNAFYSKGMSGVYSPIRTYSYIDDRIQTEFAGQTQVNLAADGVMNDVKLFNWNYLLTDAIGCPDKWRALDQVTLTNPSSFVIETKNILGTYSSSLYGRSGTEPIAVAGNAKNSEIGFESFEEYPVGSLYESANATTNLSFYTELDQPNRVLEDRFDVKNGFGQTGYVDIPISELSQYDDIVLRIHADGYNGLKAEEKIVRLSSSDYTLSPGSIAGETQINIVNTQVFNISGLLVRYWRGELFATKTIPDYPATINNWVEITDAFAHTGKKSIIVTKLTGTDFFQGKLTLKAGEKYQLSGWVRSANNRFLLKSYDKLFNGEMKLEFFDFNGVLVSSQILPEETILIGTFIEDWQKFTADFTMPAGAHYVSLKLPVTNEVYNSQIDDYEQQAYYDDVRIQPLDGGMQAYVYNQENQRLEATLDGNNYATFYYYDDEGNLFLVKQETSEGVITVQESRSFIQKKP